MNAVIATRLTLLFVGFIFGMSFSAGCIWLFAKHPLIRGNFVIPFKKYDEETKDVDDG